jgi:hypothetical protein
MDREKVHKAIADTTKNLLDASLTGEEYLLVLQTLVAHVLAANDFKVKKIFLMNLNADVLLRRKDKLKAQGMYQ